MTIATDLQFEFESSFLDDPFFAEEITYTPNEGQARTICAVVYRSGHKAFGQRFDRAAGNSEVRYAAEIRISRNAIAGVSIVTPKADSVSFPLVIGGPVTIMRVAAIIDQDPGTWRLGLSV